MVKLLDVVSLDDTTDKIFDIADSRHPASSVVPNADGLSSPILWDLDQDHGDVVP
jgi:hypothetical protein